MDGKLSPTKSKAPKGMGNGALGKDMVKDPDNPRAAANAESNLFNKHYNKELKLCEGKFLIYLTYLDEIPMVLCELNESALAYLARE